MKREGLLKNIDPQELQEAYREVGARIRAERLKAGLTQVELAELLVLSSDQTISLLGEW